MATSHTHSSSARRPDDNFSSRASTFLNFQTNFLVNEPKKQKNKQERKRNCPFFFSSETQRKPNFKWRIENCSTPHQNKTKNYFFLFQNFLPGDKKRFKNHRNLNTLPSNLFCFSSFGWKKSKKKEKKIFNQVVVPGSRPPHKSVWHFRPQLVLTDSPTVFSSRETWRERIESISEW